MPAQRDWSLLGSSGIQALIGDPEAFITPIELWCKMTKKKDMIKQPDIIKNERLYWGTAIESVLINSFEKDIKIELVHNKTFYDPKNHIFCSTPDGSNIWNRLQLEVKNIGLEYRYKWTIGVPKFVNLQCQWHNKIFDAQFEENPPGKCHVRALFGGNEKADFIVYRDDEMISDIEAIAVDFIDRYVKTDIEPPIDDTQAYGEYLSNKYNNQMIVAKKELIEVSDDETLKMISDLKVLSECHKETEARITKLKNLLKDRVGNNYGLLSEFGKILWYGCKGSTSPKDAIAMFCNDHPQFKPEFEKLIEKTRGESYRVFRPYWKKS